MAIALINFLATLSQTMAGFGAPLISMPFMIDWLGVHVATSVSAFIGLLTAISVLFYYRKDFNLRSVANLLLPAIAGIPLGVFLLSALESDIILTALGVLILSYALYTLFKPNLPPLEHPGWAYVFGFLSGVMGGAFNITGPIIVVYAAFRQWPPNEFRSNLQGFFLITNIFILLSHAIDGNLNASFWQATLWALPGMAVAIILGIYLGNKINIKRFRQLILVLLIVSGLRLIF